MARIRITLPECLPFATEIALYLSQMNDGNHLDVGFLQAIAVQPAHG